MGETMGDMMQAELTALRADLLRAVQDRAKSVLAMKFAVEELKELTEDEVMMIHIGLQDADILRQIQGGLEKTISEVEGTK